MAKSIFLFVLNHNPANLKSPKSICVKRFTSTLYSCTFQFFRPIFVCTALSRGTSARHTSRSRSTIVPVLLSSFRFQYRSRSDSTICKQKIIGRLKAKRSNKSMVVSRYKNPISTIIPKHTRKEVFRNLCKQLGLSVPGH